MSKARFHVFSGTGNGRSLAQDLAGRLALRGFATTILEVGERVAERSGAIAREEGDLDIFVFPVYAMSVPRIMCRYMARLGRVGGAGRRPCAAWAHILGWPFGWLYRIFGRWAWGMLFAADERCDGCGLRAPAPHRPGPGRLSAPRLPEARPRLRLDPPGPPLSRPEREPGRRATVGACPSRA